MLIPKPDRRGPTRLVPPACPDCAPPTPLIALLRLDDAVHFRCPQCGARVVAAKPPPGGKAV